MLHRFFALRLCRFALAAALEPGDVESAVAVPARGSLDSIAAGDRSGHAADVLVYHCSGDADTMRTAHYAGGWPRPAVVSGGGEAMPATYGDGTTAQHIWHAGARLAVLPLGGASLSAVALCAYSRSSDFHAYAAPQVAYAHMPGLPSITLLPYRNPRMLRRLDRPLARHHAAHAASAFGRAYP